MFVETNVFFFCFQNVDDLEGGVEGFKTEIDEGEASIIVIA